MDSIFTLIAFFVIIFIFGTLASWLLPFILPIIISSGLFPYLQEEGMYTFTLIAVHKAKMNNQKSTPKHGAIDVEYTEHEEDGDNQ